MRSAISCISALCAISLQCTHLKLTDLLSLFPFSIQYFLLVLAVVVARSVITCISAMCAISLQCMHLNLTDLLSLFPFSIQYFLVVLAVVVATLVCPVGACALLSGVKFCVRWEVALDVFLRMRLALLSRPPTRIIP